MACSMRVEVSGLRNEAEFLAYLRGCGLAATVLERNGGTAVEVGYEQEEEERLRDDVWAALRGWLAEDGLPLVPSAPDAGRYVLRPPGD